VFGVDPHHSLKAWVVAVFLREVYDVALCPAAASALADTTVETGFGRLLPCSATSKGGDTIGR
jgi:hypothetical protein